MIFQDYTTQHTSLFCSAPLLYLKCCNIKAVKYILQCTYITTVDTLTKMWNVLYHEINNVEEVFSLIDGVMRSTYLAMTRTKIGTQSLQVLFMPVQYVRTSTGIIRIEYCTLLRDEVHVDLQWRKWTDSWVVRVAVVGTAEGGIFPFPRSLSV